MMELSRIGKVLIVAGLLLAGLGALLVVGGRIPWIGRLPGDFYYESEHVRIYVPLTTCLLLSILLSLLFYGLSRG